MKTVTFYSYKGGVGRSLALAYTAKYLAECNFTVCIIDIDLEAPGIIYKFQEKPDHSRLGVVDYIHTCIHDKPPESITDFFYTVPRAKNGLGYIKLMSAGRGLGADYWRTLSKIDWVDLFAGDTAEGLFIFEMLKHQIETQLNPDYLFIDSRTGVTIMSKICNSIIPDITILFMANNQENFYGSRLMYNHIAAATEYKVNETPTDIICALTRIPQPQFLGGSDAIYTSKLIEELGIPSLRHSDILVIHSERSIESNEHSLTLGENESIPESTKRDYYQLITKIVSPEMIDAKRNIIVNDPKYSFIEYSVSEFVKEELKRLRGRKSPQVFHDEVEALVEQGVTSHENLYALAVCKRHFNEPIEAIVRLSAALAYDVADVKLRSQIYYFRGLMFLYDLSNYQEAKNNLQAAYQLNEEHAPLLKYHLAACLFCLDEFEGALEYVDIYLNGDDEDYKALLLRAYINYVKLKNENILNWNDSAPEIESMMSDFAKSIEFAPDYAYTYNCRGNLYDALNDTENAIMDFDKAIELNPNHFAAYNNRGRTYAILKDTHNALRDFVKAIELNPNDYRAYYNRASMYHNLDDTKNALVDYDKTIELNPELFGAYISRGNVYYHLYDNKRALADYDKAIELNPSYSDIYLQRSLVYLELGEEQKSEENMDIYAKLTSSQPTP